MNLKKPRTENERLLSSVLLVFIAYFGLNSVIFTFFGSESFYVYYLMSLSFLGGMLAGVVFFLWTRPPGVVAVEGDFKRKLDILYRALTDDERVVVALISNSEGVTQDSIRFKTGFSKSKVSALLSELEKKDIIMREKLGRTYKLFISDWLHK